MDYAVAIIIVVYNCKLKDSVSYQKADHYKDALLIIIIDNSNNREILLWNQTESQKKKILYLTYECNIGLSKAYNCGIKLVQERFRHVKWIITADQDTSLTDQYFETVFVHAFDKQSNLIFYPDVYAQNKKLSPSKLSSSYVNGTRGNITAINSGLMISVGLFDYLKYEEELFLDMIDYDLFCQLYTLDLQECMLPMHVKIEQKFSGRTRNGAEKDYDRFKIYVMDYQRFCKKWNVNNYYKYYILLKRAVKLTLYYKNLEYIKLLLSSKSRKVSADQDDSDD